MSARTQLLAEHQDEADTLAPAGPAAPVDALLVASVARRFYLENRSKVEIAKEFGVSRFKVARLLEAAVAHDIVRIEITVPAEIDSALGKALTERYGLRHGMVVDLPPGGDPVGDDTQPAADRLSRWLGTAAAQLVAGILEEGDVLGLDGSPATAALSEAVTQLPACDVVQLTGAHGQDLARDTAAAAVRRTAAVGGGRAFPLYVPFLLPDPATATLLRSHPDTAETLDRSGRVTKAVVGIGAWHAGLSPVHDALTVSERETLRARGACADVAGQVYDTAGRAVPTELAARTISATAGQLRGATEVIGVAGGARGVEALRAVLRARLLTGVVTDAATARLLLRPEVVDLPWAVPTPRAIERGQ
ncbi:sugar-binding transcriptional regulator [Streptomyces tendae]|uniref:sugar-binding transcriptional regulator n=1 Tax=Streptomyces tendae TaxID=1932 RepID=UPI0037BD68D6